LVGRSRRIGGRGPIARLRSGAQSG
jgi:hypothetical protein